tara:strand:+ start:4421 stop:4771 length:351 start_codon:yes stop_codon:yes gene_type:complete
VVRPATADDIAGFLGDVPVSMQAWVGEIDGEAIALGGFAFVAGRVVGFLNHNGDERAKQFPVTLHKTAIRVLREAHDAGHRHILSEQGKSETARKWLSRLGFVPVDDEEGVQVCRR